MRKKRKFNRNTPQSTPTSPISMSDALADAVEAIDFVLRNENVDITVPASDVAWLRLQNALGSCRVALNPETDDKEQLWNADQ